YTRLHHHASLSPVSLLARPARQVDFTQLTSEQSMQLYNPFQLDASGNRTPSPNNQIPLSMMNPVAGNLFSSGLYPLPLNGDLVNNFVNTSRSYNNMNQGDVRVD